MKRTKSNDLFDFMVAAMQEMAAEYDRIQKRASEDPGTAGDEGEENWAEFLRDWLPPTIHFVTKGRILNKEGATSPQVDILILHPTYPKKLRDKKQYLAGGVVAAFECKLTLKAEHIHKAVKNAAKISRLLPVRTGTPYKELNSPIIYGLLAHSHSWKGEKSNPTYNIIHNLQMEDKKTVKHPREMMDFLCVADLATWVASKVAMLYTPQDFGLQSPPSPKQRHPEPPFTFPEDFISPATGYGCYGLDTLDFPVVLPPDEASRFSPIGVFVATLLRKLAWENSELRRLANYFGLLNITGAEGDVRLWNTSVYSEQTRDHISAGALSKKPWDEWSQLLDLQHPTPD